MLLSFTIVDESLYSLKPSPKNYLAWHFKMVHMCAEKRGGGVYKSTRSQNLKGFLGYQIEKENHEIEYFFPRYVTEGTQL